MIAATIAAGIKLMLSHYRQISFRYKFIGGLCDEVLGFLLFAAIITRIIYGARYNIENEWLLIIPAITMFLGIIVALVLQLRKARAGD